MFYTNKRFSFHHLLVLIPLFFATMGQAFGQFAYQGVTMLANQVSRSNWSGIDNKASYKFATEIEKKGKKLKKEGQLITQGLKTEIDRILNELEADILLGANQNGLNYEQNFSSRVEEIRALAEKFSPMASDFQIKVKSQLPPLNPYDVSMKYGDLAMGDYYDATKELSKYTPEKVQKIIDKGVGKVNARKNQVFNRVYGPHLILRFLDWWNKIPCPNS